MTAPATPPLPEEASETLRLPVGAFFLRNIDGWVGRSVAAMQGFVRGGSFWTHAGLVLGGGWTIQAQPGGAKLLPVETLFNETPLLVSDAPVQGYMAALRVSVVDAACAGGRAHDETSCRPCTVMEQTIRARVSSEGNQLVGAAYSFLDYPALGLAEWARVRPSHAPLLNSLSLRLRNYINNSGHLICSALVDRAFFNAGICLFDDDRMPGDVTPEDLADYAYEGGRTPLIDTRENLL